MKVSIHGVRGSIPTSSPETTYFGGNTSCLTVKEGDCMLILDGGSGLQKVTPDKKTKRLDILLTHFHMDHIQGLGFFNPLFDADKEIHIWGPSSITHGLQSRLNRFLSPPLFPVLMRDLPCTLILHDISSRSFEIGPFRISSQFVIHPGATLGFRIQGNNAVLAFIPDHEPALGPKGMIADKKWISGFELADGADLLFHDAQYTQREYGAKVGWGHSGMEDAIRLAIIAEAKKLLFTHHDPAHTDDQLREILEELKAKYGSQLDFEFAREGMEIELG